MKTTITATFKHFGFTWLIHPCPLTDTFTVRSEDGRKLCEGFCSAQAAKTGAIMLLDHIGRAKTLEALK